MAPLAERREMVSYAVVRRFVLRRALFELVRCCLRAGPDLALVAFVFFAALARVVLVAFFAATGFLATGFLATGFLALLRLAVVPLAFAEGFVFDVERLFVLLLVNVDVVRPACACGYLLVSVGAGLARASVGP